MARYALHGNDGLIVNVIEAEASFNPGAGLFKTLSETHSIGDNINEPPIEVIGEPGPPVLPIVNGIKLINPVTGQVFILELNEDNDLLLNPEEV